MRFSFVSQYKLEKIGNLVIQKGKRAKNNELMLTPYSITNNDGFISQEEQWEGASYTKTSKEGYKVVEFEDIAYNPARINVGSVGLFTNSKGIVSSLYVCFHTNEKINPVYLFSYMKSEKFLKHIHETQEGGVRSYFFFDKLIKSQMWIPEIDEQEKIVNFLSLINERIGTQNKIIRDLKTEFLFLLNNCFAGEKNATIGTYIREESCRNKKNNEYPVFSVSNKRGFIPQNEQFDDREVASNDKTNYKIVSLNQFAYNPARINVGSIGLYKNESPCIISPMYNVFSVVNINPFIFELYFKSSCFINEMNKRLEGSVRMCLTIDGLKGIEFHLPSQTFLNSFAKAMDVLKRKIELEEKLLSFYQTQKKYLLANLFI